MLKIALLLPALSLAGQNIWDGVYTAAQAERGKTAYDTSCTNCHNRDLAGSVRAPALKGDKFMLSWQNGSINNLFSKIRFSMPATYPETVSDEVKLDIVAYLLQQNGFPAGAAELKMAPDQLEAIQIVQKGRTELPNFVLVQAGGCLCFCREARRPNFPAGERGSVSTRLASGRDGRREGPHLP